MRIGVAQIKPIKGNVTANVVGHKRFVTLAAAHHADALFFPELSLTGYEPELAGALATDLNDERLNEFQVLSDTYRLTIGVGLPIRSEAGILIGVVIFQPHKPRQLYAKQRLHADELPFFVAGAGQLILTVAGTPVAPAICYESLQMAHAQQAHSLGASVYVASVAKSQNGVVKAYKHYPDVARAYAMPVLMANCVGHCDNFESAGSSAVWHTDGQLVGQFDSAQEGVLVWDTRTQMLTTESLRNIESNPLTPS